MGSLKQVGVMEALIEYGEGERLPFAGLNSRKRSNSSCWMGTCSVEL